MKNFLRVLETEKLVERKFEIAIDFVWKAGSFLPSVLEAYREPVCRVIVAILLLSVLLFKVFQNTGFVSDR